MEPEPQHQYCKYAGRGKGAITSLLPDARAAVAHIED